MKATIETQANIHLLQFRGDTINNSSLLAAQLIDSVCPKAVCNDVDRAILAASIGG